MSTRTILAFSIAAAGLCSAASADFFAYSNDTTAPNQDYGANLSLGFNVNQAITVTALGAYFGNSLSNLLGHAGGTGVDVGIFNRDTDAQIGSTAHFDPTTFDFTMGGDAFINTSITLVPGHYAVVAFNSRNYNTFGAANATQTQDAGGGLISFSNAYGSFYDDGGTLENPHIGPYEFDRFDAGTFAYIAAVPVPAAAYVGVSGLAGVAGLGLIRRRRAMKN